MSVLGIKNRTENWRTAYHFSPFFWDEEARLRLAKELIANHEWKQWSDANLEPGEVHIELFWRGTRDHLYRSRKKNDSIILNQGVIKELADHYRNHFPDLREKVESSGLFNELKDSNYKVSTFELEKSLASNLYGTEIDIVLASQDYLFIGEAKDEMGFNANGDLVLVHQLIRQYVMARILVERLEPNKKVVPFVVWDRPENQERPGQIKFLLAQDWMNEKNVLTWKQIRDLWP